jgi:hypothetical protein
MRVIAIALWGALLTGDAALAESATAPLSGPEITAELQDRSFRFASGVIQTFSADGSTQYGESTGQWRVEGDRYCSAWPPSDSWACYDVFRIAGGVRFVGDGGGIDDGVLVP